MSSAFAKLAGKEAPNRAAILQKLSRCWRDDQPDRAKKHCRLVLSAKTWLDKFWRLFVAMGCENKLEYRQHVGLKYCILAVLGVLIVSGCVQKNLKEYYESTGSLPPSDDTVFVCHGFACTYTTPVSRKAIVDIFKNQMSKVVSPASEREMIRVAISKIESYVAPIAGTENDKGGLTPPDLVGDTSQQDCIDESTNTTSYLLVAQQAKILRFHSVSAPANRGFLFDGRWPHQTAVIKQLSNQKQWAVDSWVNDNSGPPHIQNLDEWLLTW